MNENESLQPYIDAYIDFAIGMEMNYEESVRNKVAALSSMKPMTEDGRQHLTNWGASQPLFDLRTEAQFLEDDVRLLHEYRSRIHQAVWQISRVNKDFCLAHVESSFEDQRGRLRGWNYELLLEPFGSYPFQWRVLFGDEHTNIESDCRVFSSYEEAQAHFFARLKELPRWQERTAK